MNVCGNNAMAIPPYLLLQLHDGHSASALFMRRRVEAATNGCDFRNPRDRFLQPAGAVAVNHAHGALIGDQRLVEESLRPFERLVDRQPITFRSESDPFARTRST